MRWDRLDDDTRQEALRLARLGQVHPDGDVACAAWELATETTRTQRWLGRAITVVLLAVDLVMGGSGAPFGGSPDGRSVRQRWRDRRAVRSIHRTYRRSGFPERYRALRAEHRVTVAELTARYRSGRT